MNMKKVKLTLGKDYRVLNQVARLIKVTPRGFNFLNMETNRCVFHRAFYSKEKLFPNDVNFTATFEFPEDYVTEVS